MALAAINVKKKPRGAQISTNKKNHVRKNTFNKWKTEQKQQRRP